MENKAATKAAQREAEMKAIDDAKKVQIKHNREETRVHVQASDFIPLEDALLQPLLDMQPAASPSVIADQRKKV